MSELSGLFKAKYGKLEGKDWIRKIDPEDARVLITVGLREMDFGRMGGKARAALAIRDERGRFKKQEFPGEKAYQEYMKGSEIPF